MELAIIAAVALVGWSLSPAGISRRRQNTPSVHVGYADDSEISTAEYPFDPETEHQELLDSDTRKIQRHIQGTRAVLQEYAKSDKTAAVDTQRKMELFTGNDLSWKKKQDVPRLFDPNDTRIASGVSSGGASLSVTSYDPSVLKDRNVFGSTMNNALPFAQERVGPGLGVDENVPSADGLHPQFRVLPTHMMNAYRTNQLPGRSSAGASQIASGSRRFDTFQQTQPSLVNHVPNPGPGRTSFQAQAFYPTLVQKHTRSENMGEFPRSIGHVPTTGAPCHPELTHMPTKRDTSVPVTGRAATQYEMYERSGRNLRDPKAGSLLYSTEQTITAPGSSISRGTIASDLTSSSLRESRSIYGVGGGSYLSAPSNRSRVRRGSKRCSDGRAQHGSLQGGLVTDSSTMGNTHIRKSKNNAFTRAVAGRAPYAQQRECQGEQRVSKKVKSDNPYGQWDSLGLGLVDVHDT